MVLGVSLHLHRKVSAIPGTNHDGSVADSTGKNTGVLARYTNSDGTIDIQAALGRVLPLIISSPILKQVSVVSVLRKPQMQV